ncbi:MAG: beta-ketoacyl synthase N-terminal-like domain-containing protein [Myxococcota bacterium]
MIGVLAVGAVLPEGLRRLPGLAELPDDRAAVVDGPDLGPWLKRRKDARLLARAAQLALPAAGVALQRFAGDPESLGLYVAIGREPPDEGEAEPSLAAMERDGRLDVERLAAGLALYPPLLPLRTLPNMVLAHVAIQHGIRGENGTFAGGREAGEQALAAGMRAVAEGRCALALVGAAFSAVDLASARDRWRMGPDPRPPGEGAIFALIGEGGRRPEGAWRWEWDGGPVEGLAAVYP